MNNQTKESKLICDFLQSRKLICIKALEERCGLPNTTISQALNGSRKIPKKHLALITAVLVLYGFEQKNAPILIY